MVCVNPHLTVYWLLNLLGAIFLWYSLFWCAIAADSN